MSVPYKYFLASFSIFSEIAMPSDVGIWDLAISISNQKLLSGEEESGRPRERSLVFLGSR